jgi:hypothetical protein
MSRLVAFGCSNTWGEGLPDTWNAGDEGRWQGQPSKFAWPQPLADKMNLECVNMGEGGVSNKYIANLIAETEFQQDDIVVVLWTYFTRSCVFQDDGSVRRILVQDISCLGMPTDHRKWNKIYYKNFYTDQEAIKDGYFRANFAKLYLDSIGIKNYHYTCVDSGTQPTGPSSIKPAPKWSCIDFPDIKFINLDTALDEMHPGINSQKRLAIDIYKDLNKNYDI